MHCPLPKYWIVTNQLGALAGARSSVNGIWGFPKIRGTILGGPMMRTIVYWGLY